MDLYIHISIAVAMAMDAFAVSICKGVCSKEKYLKTGLVCGSWFGGFQALMPLIGWSIAMIFVQLINQNTVEQISGYIAFGLLAFLGVKMIKEALEKEDECDCCSTDSSLGFKTMLMFAIATSIDALAIGVTVAFEAPSEIWLSITLIGIVTFLFSFFGSIIGAKIGSKFKKKAELIGGIVLVLLALRFLFDAIFH